MVRASFVYLIAGLLLAIVTSSSPRVLAGVPVVLLRPVAVHLLTVGWLTQLIMGVMHWMFPKQSQEQPRGREWLVWLAFGALNFGLILRAAAEPGLALNRAAVWAGMLVVSAVLQWLASALFVANTWGRVRSR